MLTFWRPTRAQLDAYAEVGVDQMVVTPWEPLTDAGKALDGIAQYAEEMGLTPPAPAGTTSA